MTFRPFLPIPTVRDPAVSSEGGIDPLGLYAIADALALKMIPGIRERQSHPRYLTAMAVSRDLCKEYDDEAVASDGESSARQVFEWYLVMGLVCYTENKEVVGIPGSLKALAAQAGGVPLSAANYLKTPSVFGIHGIYKLLSRELELESDAGLMADGEELLELWSHEQGLCGFVGARSGSGRRLRGQWLDAIRDGMKCGHTDRSKNWEGWSSFYKYLAYEAAGVREREWYWDKLTRDTGHARGEVLRFLISREGRAAFRGYSSERDFHVALARMASPPLRALLEAIDAYERFARLLTDAFFDCLCELSRHRQKAAAGALAHLPGVQKAASEASPVFQLVEEKLEPFQLAERFYWAFGPFAAQMAPADWVTVLMSHHHKVQSQKPPAGKNAWLQMYSDGRYEIRTRYVRESGGTGDNEYVHTYRTRSLCFFARDLGRLP